jgi:hypothetical protein
MNRIVAALAAGMAVAALPGLAAPPRFPPVIVHIDAVGDRCLVTAEGQPIDPAKPLPPAMRQQMLARGVRLTFADPRPPFFCISGVIFPFQAAGIDVRT